VTGPTFSYDLVGEPPRLTLHGELDEIASIELRDVIGSASAELQRDLVVDLSDVDFFPSAAVGVLATARAGAQAHGATVALVAADGSIAQRVLMICALPYEVV
jgi:anti-anti-sigma factor